MSASTPDPAAPPPRPAADTGKSGSTDPGRSAAVWGRWPPSPMIRGPVRPLAVDQLFSKPQSRCRRAAADHGAGRCRVPQTAAEHPGSGLPGLPVSAAGAWRWRRPDARCRGADITYVPLTSGFVRLGGGSSGLVEPLRDRLGGCRTRWTGRSAWTCWRRRCVGAGRSAQRRPGDGVHRPGVDGPAGVGKVAVAYGRSGTVPGQRVRGAAVGGRSSTRTCTCTATRRCRVRARARSVLQVLQRGRFAPVAGLPDALGGVRVDGRGGEDDPREGVFCSHRKPSAPVKGLRCERERLGGEDPWTWEYRN